MFELGTSVIDPPLSSASDLLTLIAKVQEARLHPKQQAIPLPRQSAPPPRVDRKGGIPSLSVSDHHTGFRRVARAQAIPHVTATDGLKIISVEEGRRTLRARSIQPAKLKGL
jgi:hypothetical protein